MEQSNSLERYPASSKEKQKNGKRYFCLFGFVLLFTEHGNYSSMECSTASDPKISEARAGTRGETVTSHSTAKRPFRYLMTYSLNDNRELRTTLEEEPGVRHPYYGPRFFTRNPASFSE